MSKRFFALVVFALAATLLTKSAFAGETLTYSHIFPPTHPHHKLVDSWGKEINKRTDGRVTIQIFPGQTLTKGPQIYDGVVNGISDLGMALFAYTRGRFPVIEAVDLPLGYPSGKVASAVVNEVYRTFKPKELDDVKVMYLSAHGPGLLHTKDTPIKSMDDLKGIKFRATGFSAKLVNALGGTPVAMPMPETYQALSKGVVDGATFPYEAGKGFRLFDTIKYTIECMDVAYTSSFFVVMNKDRWNSLSPIDQKTIEEINTKWATKTADKWDEIDVAGRAFLKEKGGTAIPLSPEESARWKVAVAPVIDDYISAVAKKGIDGKEVVQITRAALKKYTKEFSN